MGIRNLIGQRFGRLVVVALSPRRKYGRPTWSCQCDCGNRTLLNTGTLRGGNTRSCGCLRNEITRARSLTHGLTRTPSYQRWLNMKNRCYNPRVKSYCAYGGRGIRVCARWRESFEVFLQDMGEPPTPKHEIDRIDNDGDYSPENCRWVTTRENRQHRRNITHLTVDGVTLPLREWARHVGLNPHTLYYRAVLQGWDHERAVRTPLLHQ